MADNYINRLREAIEKNDDDGIALSIEIHKAVQNGYVVNKLENKMWLKLIKANWQRKKFNNVHDMNDIR